LLINLICKIADIGCGTGAQTMALAQHTKGHITAVDLFPVFLEKLNERAQEKGLSDRITTLARSMEDLPFEGEALDIIWSEGAIYIMGFEKGVRDWKRFLKPGGYLAYPKSPGSLLRGLLNWKIIGIKNIRKLLRCRRKSGYWKRMGIPGGSFYPTPRMLDRPLLPTC
jgi:ubiquinone/menaquinone biosynthesis C-methylase UbiE